ncbi:MAG: winged helix-turn-helix domain-containing protein [Edaphobacter sp.]|uniref:winged helix-turn-helix domain-containing protein n=1 Tax=Edaphobacter sp. TaxID=1934404 RepID=UPI0023937A01|nr:winged helix-turn-helix domain-containing protein [Edaphobacter sp.]MDE1175693.1 winged helix-turn-helix domain-containing protein [Edaphobacter sp.]
MRQVSNPVRVAFGTFEADLSSGELWRGGFRIKLQGQPFRVLAELVQRPGQVITREELQERVWDPGTNVDFDHSLGTAINKIREALGDNADNPRFVETLTRRGYRFIAPVTLLDTPSPAPVPLISDAGTAPNSDETEPEAFAAAAEEVRNPSAKAELHGRHWMRWLLVPGLLAAATAGYFIGRSRVAPQVPSLRQITHAQRVLPGGDALESFPVTVTDGLHLFASVIRDGGVHLERITIAGGGSEPIVLPDEIAGPAIADISHDGSHLLVRSHASNQSEQPLFIVPASGWSAQRMMHVLAHDATWMPDDQNVLYAADNELFETSPNGSASVHYASLPGRAFWLRWSPDGKVLRFTLFNPLEHTLALWELSAKDHRPHPLLGDWSPARKVCCGNWLPDGGGFVFEVTQGAASDVWLLRKGSSQPVRLTDGPLAYQGPVPARTQQRVFLTGMSSEGEVQLLHPGAHEFVPARSFYSGAHRLEQTRDGNWMAWVDTDGRLWRARSDGSELLQLTPGDLQVFSAHWSPDGSRLALMARATSGAWSIYQVLADGSDLEPLLQSDSNAADPTWSPDGKTIVVGQGPDLMGKDAAPRTIQMLDVKSHQLTTLPDSRGLFSPRWSLDGLYIVALSLDQKQLRLYDVAKKQWRVLSNRSAADPVWSEDSKWIYTDAFMDSGQPVYRVSIADGHIEELGGMANLHSTEFSDMVLCGLLHDGTIAVRARLTTANLFSLDLDKKN